MNLSLNHHFLASTRTAASRISPFYSKRGNRRKGLLWKGERKSIKMQIWLRKAVPGWLWGEIRLGRLSPG